MTNTGLGEGKSSYKITSLKPARIECIFSELVVLEVSKDARRPCVSRSAKRQS